MCLAGYIKAIFVTAWQLSERESVRSHGCLVPFESCDWSCLLMTCIRPIYRATKRRSSYTCFSQVSFSLCMQTRKSIGYKLFDFCGYRKIITWEILLGIEPSKAIHFRYAEDKSRTNSKGRLFHSAEKRESNPVVELSLQVLCVHRLKKRGGYKASRPEGSVSYIN